MGDEVFAFPKAVNEANDTFYADERGPYARPLQTGYVRRSAD